MTLNLRRMRKYHPRRSSKEIKLNKQKLMDLEHQIKADVGEFLVLIKEGSNDEALKSYQKAKGDLLKYKPDMEKVAEAIGKQLISALNGDEKEERITEMPQQKTLLAFPSH